MACNLTDKIGKPDDTIEDIWGLHVLQLTSTEDIDWCLAHRILSDLHFVCNCYE